MIQIKNVTITHRYDLHTILENFSFVLNPGDKAVIVGEEGNGKSTLLKWIFQPELTESYAKIQGERILNREKLGYLPQELPREDREKSIYEFFCEEELFWETDQKELSHLSGRLGIPLEYFYSEQKMDTLSGGEKVKVQMARLLLGKPTVLLLDEPSNDMEIAALEWLENLIAETPMAVLYISHDETLIEKTATIVIHLEQICRKTKSRATVAHMGYEEYLKSRQLSMENQKRRAKNDRREAAKQQEKLQKMMQQVNHDLDAVSRQDPHAGYLLKKKMKAVKSMEKRFFRESREMEIFPEEENAIFFRMGEAGKMPYGKIWLDYKLDQLKTPEGRLLSEKIRLQIKGPQKVCITGANGVGKTTLLKKIAEQLSGRTDLKVISMPQNYEEALPLSGPVIRRIFSQYEGAILSVSHDRTYISQVCTRVYELEKTGLKLIKS